MPTASTAANAYAALARMTSSSGDMGKGLGKSLGTEGGEASFGAMLKNAIGSVVETGRASDNQVKAVASGSANMVDVVSAVAETEVAVEALVSVRDKVIQAYEEIMRMPI
jgi:flagellar hook-basal body complex protein FliE